MKIEQLKKLIYKIANNRDKVAFNEIFNHFAPRVLGYLIGSGTSKEIAEEITQDILSTIWHKAFQFNSQKGNPNTWIFTIARNKRIDRIRKKENPEYNTFDLIDALYSNDIDQSYELEEKIRDIQSKLSENERKLIKMNFFEGKTHKKISRDLEIPLGTVKSRIRNILIKMKNL